MDRVSDYAELRLNGVTMTAEEYRNEIDRLMRNGGGEKILNGSADHAAIILERMFHHGKESIKIFSRSFTPNIYGNSMLLSAAQSFLSRGHRVNIIVEEKHNVSGALHPFFKQLRDYDAIDIRHLHKKLAPIVNTNFSVKDDTDIRVSDEAESMQAVATFGDMDEAKKLSRYFDKLHLLSTPINYKTIYCK